MINYSRALEPTMLALTLKPDELAFLRTVGECNNSVDVEPLVAFALRQKSLIRDDWVRGYKITDIGNEVLAAAANALL